MKIEILPPNDESLIHSKLLQTPTGKRILEQMKKAGITLNMSEIILGSDPAPEQQAVIFASYALMALRNPRNNKELWARTGLNADIEDLKILQAELGIPVACEIVYPNRSGLRGLPGKCVQRLTAFF